MSRVNVVHSRASEDLFGPANALGHVTLPAGAVATGYALANLSNGTPSVSCQFTDDFVTILIDHGAPVVVQMPALIHTNLRSTATALFQRNATNAWGAPTVNRAFTLTDPDADGLRPNPWIDCTGDGALRWTRIVITANALPVILGQILLAATIYELAVNIQNAPTLTPTFQTTVLTTNVDVDLRAKRAPRRWALKGDVKAADLDALLDLQAWHQDAAGQAGSFLVAWDPATISANAVWFCRHASDAQPYVPQFLDDNNDVSVDVLELGRGQVWP